MNLQWTNIIGLDLPAYALFLQERASSQVIDYRFYQNLFRKHEIVCSLKPLVGQRDPTA